MIDFAAVTPGGKELDDFEEIQYQPPETEIQLNNFSKRNRKSQGNDKSDLSKFPKRKSNRHITASKLCELATKRKKSKTNIQQSSLSDTTDINSDDVNTADEATAIHKEDTDKNEEKTQVINTLSKSNNPTGSNLPSESPRNVLNVPTSNINVVSHETTHDSHVFDYVVSTVLVDNQTVTITGSTPDMSLVNLNNCLLNANTTLYQEKSGELLSNDKTSVNDGTYLMTSNSSQVVDTSIDFPQFPALDKTDNIPSNIIACEAKVNNIDTDVSRDVLPSTKIPLPYSIIPFKEINTDQNISFFDSSNSQSESVKKKSEGKSGG